MAKKDDVPETAVDKERRIRWRETIAEARKMAEEANRFALALRRIIREADRTHQGESLLVSIAEEALKP